MLKGQVEAGNVCWLATLWNLRSALSFVHSANVTTRQREGCHPCWGEAGRWRCSRGIWGSLSSVVPDFTLDLDTQDFSLWLLFPYDQEPRFFSVPQLPGF